MLRWLFPLLGVVAVLAGYVQVGSTDEVEGSSIWIAELECSIADDAGRRLECVAEVGRSGDQGGMLAAAWGIDGEFLATDQIPGSVTTWAVDDPPSGSHRVDLIVVDPENERDRRGIRRCLGWGRRLAVVRMARIPRPGGIRWGVDSLAAPPTENRRVAGRPVPDVRCPS